MKYTLPFLMLVLFGAGCIVRQPTATITQRLPEPILSKPDSLAVQALKEGRLPPSPFPSDIGYSVIPNLEQPDCFGVESGRADGGSLLKTLANNEEHGRFLRAGFVRSLTTSTAQSLDERIHAALPTSTQFLATYVCLLRSDVALVVGLPWPASSTVWTTEDRQTYSIDSEVQSASMTSSTLFLVTNAKVRRLDEVRPWNPFGPPGGDPSPCNASLVSGGVRWECGEWIEVSKGAAKRWHEEGATGDFPYELKKRVYTIPLKGGRVSSWLE